MGKIGFVTDSTAYLPVSFKERFEIEVVSLTINFEGKSFREEGLYDDFDAFYKKLNHAFSLPTTSQPSIGEFLNVYQKLGERVDSIVSVHITEGISGTVKTARAAARMLPELDITVIDSHAAAVGEYMILKAAVQAALSGCTKDEIIEIIQYIIEHHSLLFLPSTLEYLRRGGRIGGAAALLGTLLQIKPILFFNPEKNCIIDLYEKVRTREKGLQRILAEIKKALYVYPDLITAVVYVGTESYGMDMVKRVQAIYPGALPELCPVGPVIGAHIGPGTVGLYFCPRTSRLKKLLERPTV